ncbi:hypothetical protein C8R45DRAFT_970139 [Mycena sanguinolenta]|nr:hypothetical protein C8R45DRAFT_970139 [Mycena sanguinolenta]
MTSVALTAPSIDFLGAIWNWTLLGSLVLQVYSYAQVYHKHDRPGIKWLVYTIFVVEILLSIFLLHMNFDLMVSKWGNPQGFMFFTWSGCTVAPGSGVERAPSIISRNRRRIWMLNQHILARIITAVIITVKAPSRAYALTNQQWKTRYQLNTFLVAEVPILKKLTAMWLIGSFVVDVLIATAMVLSLVNSRRELRREFTVQKTENLINRLIVVTVETGVITAVTALVDLTLYLLPIQGQTYHTVPASILGKLYSNVLMANLNGRARSAAFRAGLQDSDFGDELDVIGGVSTALESRGSIVSSNVHSVHSNICQLRDRRRE